MTIMDPKIQLGEFLTLGEAIKSDWAIRHGNSNLPDNEEQLENLKNWTQKIYDPLCRHFGFKIPRSSVFRNFVVNKGVKGSKTSQHMLGQAGDLEPEGMKGISNSALFNYIRNSNLPWDELIWEFGDDNNPAWVHVSWSETPQKEVLKAVKVAVGNGKFKTKYLNL